MITDSLRHVPEAALMLEHIGVEGIWAAETDHDPFFRLLLAAEHAPNLKFGTAIAVAFARSPMLMAYEIAAIHSLAPGNVIIGLGTQVRSHIRYRYDMPWSEPVPRMREYVSALRSIWEAWSNSSQLKFRGSFYRNTLAPPFFRPPIAGAKDLQICIAGFGPRLTELAGEVGDGYLFHPFATPEYLRTVSKPAVHRGLAKRSGENDDFLVSGVISVVTGTDEEIDGSLEGARYQIAFYAATPTYRSILALHGLEDLHQPARRMILQGRWGELPHIVSEEVLNLFSVVAEPLQLPHILRERFASVADRLIFPLPPSMSSEVDMWRNIVRDLDGPSLDTNE